MIERTIKKYINECLKAKPIILIIGARQVGKSTLCYEFKKELNYNYVSLDDLSERKLAVTDPELFLQLHKWPLIIDEVQYAPQLFDVIESIVNKQKLENGSNSGMYILTGSQSYNIMSYASQSMAGRVAIIKMPPLSTSEINKMEEKEFFVDINRISNRVEKYHITPIELSELIVKGMYPELYSNPNMNSDLFYSNYIQTYIERDVSQIINIKDKIKFQNFMEMLASLTGEELVYDNIAKTIGVKVDTIKAWISVLVAGDIVYLIKPYNDLSIAKRVVKRPKIVFSDTGLACYLSRLNNAEVLRKSIFYGRFVESYIINEIKKSYENNGSKDNLFYYRDNNQNEIDLVILNKGTIHLVECKSGISYSKSDIKGFKQLMDTSYALGTSCIICNTASIYSIDKEVFVLPITSI